MQNQIINSIIVIFSISKQKHNDNKRECKYS